MTLHPTFIHYPTLLSNIYLYQDDIKIQQIYMYMSDIEYTEEQYEEMIEGMEKIFPDANFSIDVDFLYVLDELLTDKKHIFISNDRYCYCWDGIDAPKQEFFEIKGDSITYRYVLNELIKQDFNPDCNHIFLEGIDKVSEIQYRLSMGS